MVESKSSPVYARRAAIGALSAALLFGYGCALSPVHDGRTIPQVSVRDTGRCLGLEFMSPKGGPGSAKVYTYPIIGDGVIQADVYGSFTSPAGKNVEVAPADEHTTPPIGYNRRGEFNFEWDEADTKLQTVTIESYAVIANQEVPCFPTVLSLDPTTEEVTPAIPYASYKDVPA